MRAWKREWDGIPAGARTPRSAPRTPAHPRRLAAAAAALVAALLLGGCGREPGAAPLAAGTPVVMVSIDTLRSDRLPAYGYDGVETPALEALRDEAVLFEHAYANMPLTLPSHASLFTGLLPPQHGIRDNIGYGLDPELPYLPRLLRDAGYATGGAVSAFVLRTDTGFGDGFDFYDDEVQALTWTGQLTAQRPGTETLERLLPWLREVHEQPFFLFFHIYEPHTPRRPPKRFAERFADPYDGEVAAADAIVGDLFAELRRLGRWDDALVVVFSDHGEGLDDHGEDEHGILLYREALQVPLFVKLPGGAGGGTTRADPAQLADLTPTVLGLLGLEVPDGLSGRALFAEGAAGEAPALYAETLYPRLHFGWSELTSLIDYPHHLIQGPDPELYDLAADPAERDNVLRRNQRLAVAMGDELATHDRPFERPAEADPAVAEQLAALGYLGSVAATETEGPLADPKTRIHVLQKLRGGHTAMSRGDYREAVSQFRRVLEEEPRMVDTWGQLGHALMGTGDYADALAAFQRAFELSGGAPRLALSIANALFKLERFDEAKAHVDLAVAGGENAYELLARLALSAGELDEAARQAELGLGRSGGRASLMILQAQVALQRGDLAEAVRLTDEVLKRQDPEADERMLSGLFFVRGEALAQLGQAEPAAAAFQREIEITPNDLPPYSRLALLQILSGQGREATATLRRMMDVNPRPDSFLEAVRLLRSVGDERSARIVLGEALKRWPRDPQLRQAAG